MKKLIESWQKHLNENLSEDQIEQTKDYLYNFTSNQRTVDKLFDQISSFEDAYITGRLGGGSVGTAFQLSNGNVLKVYHGTYLGTIKDQDAEYEKIMSRTFGGKSYKGDLVVYAHGIVEGEPKSISSMGTPTIGWAEINKVFTLRDYYRYLKVPPHIVEEKEKSFDTLVEDITEFMYSGLVDKDEDLYDAIDMFKNSFIFDKYRYEYLTEKELENYVTGIFKFFQINNWNPELNDVHFDNVGVLMPSDPTLVVFDY